MNAVPSKLLIVDDDDGLRRQLRWSFDGCEVVLAEDRKSAVSATRERKPQVVLLDLGLPPDADGPTEGLATLDELLAAAPNTKVIIMTGQTEREYAVQAVGQGAYDFYQKPIEIDVLSLVVERAFKLHVLEEENRRMAAGSAEDGLPGLITASADMMKICEDVRKIAPTDVAVLLTGESGTGKEVLAKAVHSLSRRNERPFVPINCAAIPDNLLESELFGHEKGAFTGAVKTTKGKVELADGGTLFLDEIGDLPSALQAKILRFLQERVIERVGGRSEIAVDLRLVAATNQDLSKMIADGRFREDLYYRLSEAEIEIPPLRDRPDDALLIARNLFQQQVYQLGRDVKGFAPDALLAISRYEWPGNVRELQNRIKRALVSATGAMITADDLGLPTAEPKARAVTLKKAREQADREALRNALSAAKGNISEAARLLGISRPTLYQMMREHNLK